MFVTNNSMGAWKIYLSIEGTQSMDGLDFAGFLRRVVMFWCHPSTVESSIQPKSKLSFLVTNNYVCNE